MPPPKQLSPTPYPNRKNPPKQPGPAKETGLHFAVLDEGTFSVPNLRSGRPNPLEMMLPGEDSHRFEVFKAKKKRGKFIETESTKVGVFSGGYIVGIVML